jgi:phage gp37-like protein
MKYTSFRDSIIAGIAAKLPELRTVDGHPGRFNLDELKRMATKLPGVKVAILGIPKTDELASGEFKATLKMAAFILVGDRRQLSKEIAALNLVEVVTTLIGSNRWGRGDAYMPENISADNLYSGSIDKKGVAIWAVTWSQAIRIGGDTWSGGVVPDNIYISDNEPDWGEHPENYDQIVTDGVPTP